MSPYRGGAVALLLASKQMVSKWRCQNGGEWGRTSGEEGQPLLLVSQRMSWTCHGCSQYIYIYKRHAGAPFAPTLLSSLSYLVGADVMELVVVMLFFIVARWKGGDADTTEHQEKPHLLIHTYKLEYARVSTKSADSSGTAKDRQSGPLPVQSGFSDI